MAQVKNLARGWLCRGCGRSWSPYILACTECAKTYEPDELRQLLERSGYRKRIAGMVRTLEKAGV